MVGLKASIAGVLGGKTVLKLGKEDPSLGTGFGVVKALQQGSEGGIGGVARLLALLKELIHRRHRPSHFPKLALRMKEKSEQEDNRIFS
ncbi:hypothetical protein TSUD_168170 [Trifolium subterraneum]|nr:hypothetical protein TSUD_168170 [Trifolium subterraneum]